jgi:hypothetical protein
LLQKALVEIVIHTRDVHDLYPEYPNPIESVDSLHINRYGYSDNGLFPKKAKQNLQNTGDWIANASLQLELKFWGGKDRGGEIATWDHPCQDR